MPYGIDVPSSCQMHCSTIQLSDISSNGLYSVDLCFVDTNGGISSFHPIKRMCGLGVVHVAR